VRLAAVIRRERDRAFVPWVNSRPSMLTRPGEPSSYGLGAWPFRIESDEGEPVFDRKAYMREYARNRREGSVRVVLPETAGRPEGRSYAGA
jgi:hypothetical protein